MRFGKLRPVIIMAAAVTIGVSSIAAGDQPDPVKPDGQAAFAVDLFRRVSGVADDQTVAAKAGNVFFSPYSVRVAMAMVGRGAGGQTADQIDHAIHLSPGEKIVPIKTTDRSDGPNADALFQLEVVNALWGQAGYPFKPDFAAAMKSDFSAEFSTVDFKKDPEAVRGQINHWADQSTHGRVPQVLPKGSVDTSTRLVLADAVYFRARWEKPFTKAMTQPEKFHLTADATADVPMMHGLVEREGYLKEDGVTVVSKPYLRGTACFVLVLPDDAAGLAGVEKSLTAERLSKWTGPLPAEKVELKLPKFTTRWNRELTPACKSLGITDAFNPATADFSKMADPVNGGSGKAEPLTIGGVFHSAFVSVDEEGTEAAAVTAVAMVGAAMAAPRPEVIHQVTADRPFLFMIVDRDTGAVLFMGRVTDPR